MSAAVYTANEHSVAMTTANNRFTITKSTTDELRLIDTDNGGGGGGTFRLNNCTVAVWVKEGIVRQDRRIVVRFI